MKNLIEYNRMGSRRRRGSALYCTVVGVALIVSLMGMLAIVTARLELRRVGQSQDAQHARGLAQSALEFGLANIDHDSDWRNTFTNNVESSPLDWQGISSEAGTMTFKLVDESDGDLADDASDMVRLYGIGRVGEAEYVSSVLLEPTGAGLDCLKSALHADGRLWINNSTDVISLTGGPISTNAQLTNWGTVNGDVECISASPVGTINGTLTAPAPAKLMPGPNVWEYYLNNGTWIDVNDVSGTSPNLVEDVVLSPGNNPYGAGATNPQGIYVIDCQGQDIRFHKVRIVGTLVLLNAGPGSDLDNDQHWEPAVPNFPVLLFDGNIDFNWHGEHSLKEGGGVNYNPPGTPYQGVDDSDDADEYPGLIKGLVYVSGNLDISHECVLEGVVVIGGYLSTYADMTLKYDPTFLNYPPPGFRAAALGSGANLLNNPGFESGTTNWAGSSCGILIDPGGDYHIGSQCLVAFSLTSPSSGPAQAITGSLQNGATYDVEVWAKMTTVNADIELAIETISSGSGTQTFTNGFTNVGTSWTQVSTTLTPTWSGALSGASFKVRNKSDLNAFKIDDAVLQQQGASTETKMQISPGSWRREPGA